MRILIVWLINTVGFARLTLSDDVDQDFRLLDCVDSGAGTWAGQCADPADSRCVDIACNAGDTGSFHFCHQRFAFLAGFQNGGRFLCQRLLGCDRGSTALQYHFVGIVHFAIEKLNANTKKFQY